MVWWNTRAVAIDRGLSAILKPNRMNFTTFCPVEHHLIMIAANKMQVFDSKELIKNLTGLGPPVAQISQADERV